MPRRALKARGVGKHSDLLILVPAANPFYIATDADKERLSSLYIETLADERTSAERAEKAIADYIQTQSKPSEKSDASKTQVGMELVTDTGSHT